MKKYIYCHNNLDSCLLTSLHGLMPRLTFLKMNPDMRPYDEIKKCNSRLPPQILNMHLSSLRPTGVVDVMPARETFCTRWRLRSSSLLKVFAIQTASEAFI